MKVKVKRCIELPSKNGYRYSEEVDDGVAEFCAWGVGYHEFDHGAGTSSTAIIKRDDGTVENVHCNMIQFIS